MVLRPATLDALIQSVQSACTQGQRIEAVDLTSLHQVLEFTPADMTVTVETGITLRALQRHLAPQRQWLPLDPPHSESLTLHELLNSNASGPRRFAFGTARDHLLGLQVVLADGRVVRNGGKVVKNVAGYDLCKLFVGAQGTLGVIVEATFKVRPLPEQETFLTAHCPALSDAIALLETVIDSAITPVVLDLHNLSTSHAGGPKGVAFQLVLGFAGTREEVEWQIAQASAFGINEVAGHDYEALFWAPDLKSATHRRSVLPSRLLETVQELADLPLVARAGNGVIYYRGGPVPPPSTAPSSLSHRIKEAYDPKRVFPELLM